MDTKILKEQMIEGIEFSYSDEEQQNEMEFWHKKDGPNWSDPFQIMFNGELFTYKTFPAFLNKLNFLINQYQLKNDKDEVSQHCNYNQAKKSNRSNFSKTAFISY